MVGQVVVISKWAESGYLGQAFGAVVVAAAERLAGMPQGSLDPRARLGKAARVEVEWLDVPAWSTEIHPPKPK